LKRRKHRKNDTIQKKKISTISCQEKLKRKKLVKKSEAERQFNSKMKKLNFYKILSKLKAKQKSNIKKKIVPKLE